MHAKVFEETQEQRVVAEFTHQAVAFNASAVMNDARTVDALIALMPCAPGQRWVEVACGPGIIARALAPHVGTVIGVDLTPAMLDTARGAAVDAGLTNVSFQQGDATALPFADAAFDGAVTRFSLHHLPEPARCVDEMARVVRPGGWVAISDHLTSTNRLASAWHQHIERLRDPSHCSCLTPSAIRRMAKEAGLRLVEAQTEPFSLDFEEWLTRGSGGAANRARIESALADRPGVPCFTVTEAPRRLHLVQGRFLWRKPAAQHL